MRALVISGGGSKGAFAGGVSQYLMQKQAREYDLFLGSSTGSLLIPYLAMGDIEKIHEIYTNVNQRSIFSLSPFITKKKGDREYVGINYMSSLLQFLKKKRTFGESKNLLKTIRNNFSKQDFEQLKRTAKDVVVTVSNLTKNQVEYKSMNDCNYDEFCDWVWISCNYVPFMSLVTKNECEYADGGFGCLVPIQEAVKRGATEIDAIILESENMEHNNVLGKNPFSLMVNLFGFMWDQVRYHNVMEGRLAAINKNVKLNLYYTPSQLTENSLIFNKKLMTEWWKQGYAYAAEKYKELQMSPVEE